MYMVLFRENLRNFILEKLIVKLKK